MADATAPFDRPGSPPPMPPADWAQAFAALPQEAPSPEVRDRIYARLRPAVSQRRRNAWPLGFAMAAGMAVFAVALAVWLPSLVDEQAGDVRSVAAARTVDDRHPGEQARLPMPPLAMEPSSEPSAVPSVAPAVVPSVASDAAMPRVEPRQVARAARVPLPGSARGERPRRATAPRRTRVDPLELPLQRGVAATQPRARRPTPADASRGEGGHDAFARGDPGVEASSVPSLQARSAQLEALLASVRDPSVGTGPGAWLAAEHDGRVATIDAALSIAPAHDTEAQRSLWQARVGALQGALAFEGALRALAAEGRQYDGALVGVD